MKTVFHTVSFSCFSSLHRMKTSWDLYSSLKMSSRQQRIGRECKRWKRREREKRREQRKTRRRRDAHGIGKERRGWQLKWNKDCVTLCGTVELHGRHLKSMVTNHHWFWKMSSTIKSFIWHLSMYLVPVSLVCCCHYGYLCKYWFFNIWSNTSLKFATLPTLWSRTGIQAA